MSSKAPEKPRAPRAPKPVRDAALQAVREAEHKRKRAEYDASMEEHQQTMAQRHKEQIAAAPSRAAAPAPAASKRAAASSSAAGPRVSRPRVGGTRPRVPQQAPALPDDHADARDATARHPAWAAWAADVERVAARCGADEAQILYDGGRWYEQQDDRPEYAAAHRALQFQRLEGLGVPPTAEEKAKLPWPHREWWEDRDRIVLLCDVRVHQIHGHFPASWRFGRTTRQRVSMAAGLSRWKAVQRDCGVARRSAVISF